MVNKPGPTPTYLTKLHDALQWAHRRSTQVNAQHGVYTVLSVYTPSPGDPDEVLDAWAAYRVAKRRYERALIASRQGPDALEDSKWL